MKTIIFREIGIVIPLENVTLPINMSFKDTSLLVKSYYLDVKKSPEWPSVIMFIVGVLCLFFLMTNIMIFKSSYYVKRQDNPCEKPKRQKMKKRQMSLIGKFSLQSQTDENPSIITFFACLRHKKGEHLSLQEFDTIWRNRVMHKHERFCCQVSSTDHGHFEVDEKSMGVYGTELGYDSHKKNLSDRIEEMLTSTLDVKQKLWEVELLTSRLPTSKDEYETIALFRVHHCLCDGVSLSVALGDVADEAKMLHHRIQQELQVKKKRLENFSKIEYFFKIILFYYMIGSIKALSLQFWRLMTSSNPFVIDEACDTEGGRTVSWKYLAPMEEMKKVIKAIHPSITVNDLAVFLSSAAISKQIASQKNRSIPSSINITIPVHMTGGILLPGQTLGNNIGAFVTNVPCKQEDDTDTAVKRLKKTSQRLQEGKHTPAPIIAYYMARFVSKYLPQKMAQWTLRNANANSVAIVSNIRGFPFTVHWLGRRVEYLNAFLPIPPGIPIGVCLQSYADEVSFTVTADKRIVPDADKFASWIKEEYQQLKQQITIKHE